MAEARDGVPKTVPFRFPPFPLSERVYPVGDLSRSRRVHVKAGQYDRRVKATPHNQRTIAEFQAKKGRGVGMFGDHVLLMTAKGVKSGEAITTPLVYGRFGDDYVVVASKGGAPDNPQWLGNIRANPIVDVEVADANGTAKFKARARMVDSREERDRLFKEMLKIWPAYADYQARTARVIPVVILDRQR